MEQALYSESVDRLSLLLGEATRSSEEGVKRFVPPTGSALSSAVSRYHHIVFGRRGSGKSSLLRKAAADLTLTRRPIAYIDLESFKGLSYPDVLISILIRTFEEFHRWLKTAAVNPASQTTFWLRKWGARPERPAFPKQEANAIAQILNAQIEELRRELYLADGSSTRVTTKTSQNAESSSGGSIGAGINGIGASISAGQSTASTTSQELQRTFLQSKVDFIHQHILEYQSIFRQMHALSGGDSYLFLDDLYHIRRADQVKLLDYFHRLAKGNHLWLKIGTIRHRTQWYAHGNPPTGMKLADDALEVDLDLTLENFGTTQRFLTQILEGLLTEAGNIQLSNILVDSALTRLVLASGGVARDFLGIFRQAIDIARNREGGHRGDKVGAEDINNAAGMYDANKRQELERDTIDERDELVSALENVRSFCFFRSQTNVLLIDRDLRGPEVDVIAELVDLRLLHKIKSRLTSWNREGTYYEAYMLDISQYTGARKRHGFTIVEFWQNSSEGENASHREDKLRKASNIFDPSADYTRLKEIPGKGSRKGDTEQKSTSDIEQKPIDWE